MSLDDLALMRTLAARPVANVALAIEPRLVALVLDGYVARTADGWLATAKGCAVLEEARSSRPGDVR